MPDCDVRGPRFESHRGQLRVFIVKTTTIYSFGHRLRTLTAVPRSTQPSTLRGMVNKYQLSGWVIINGDGGCGFWQPTGRLIAGIVWSGLRVGGRLAPCHIRHMNRVNSRSGFELRWQHHKYCRYYYYYYYYYYAVWVTWVDAGGTGRRHMVRVNPCFITSPSKITGCVNALRRLVLYCSSGNDDRTTLDLQVLRRRCQW